MITSALGGGTRAAGGGGGVAGPGVLGVYFVCVCSSIVVWRNTINKCKVHFVCEEVIRRQC